MSASLRSLKFLPCLAAILLAGASTLHASTISATVYENVPDAVNAADLANNETAAYATFNVSGSGIDFQSELTSYFNVTAFLNNPTYTFQSTSFNPNGGVDNIELVITGSVFLLAGANSFVVGHDDGVVLNIPGIGYNTGTSEAGPTSFTTTPFSVNNPGAAGNYAFSLDYAECCGAPADLEFTVNSAPITSTTPEPGSFALLGTGLLALAGVARRRFAL
jgi:hypothetical protein